MSFLRCDSDLIIDEITGQPSCSQWSVVPDSDVLSGNEILQLLLIELQSLNDFDHDLVARLLGYFAVITITGYTAGFVTRLLKKA